tara:strand:+ start:325 stop:1701 length:1377 start_codon:yes stop_codon:yes gene_type:complete
LSRFDANKLELWTQGEWQNRVPSAIDGFCNDTRKLEKNDLFVAIKTSQRDGHDFLDVAQESGATGAIVSEYRSESALPQLLVADSLQGFQSIAAAYRNDFEGTVIGVTGSCGKTTCKELIGLLLGAPDGTLITQGNLNNFLGVPLTLTELEASAHRFAVVEAGISEPGEMELLSGMIQADVAVCTSVGAAHLEALESVDNVAREKAKIVHPQRTGRAYIDVTSAQYLECFGEIPIIVAQESVEPDKVGAFSLCRDGSKNEMCLRLSSGDEVFEFDAVQTSFATNVALAILVTSDLGVSADRIRERLKEWKASSLRGEIIERAGQRIYLDCYNANPLSMFDAIESFDRISKETRAKLYIVGSMEELGSSSRTWHQRLGEKLDLGKLDRAYLVGDYADGIISGMNEASRSRTEKMDSVENLKEIVSRFEGDVFIKGSRRYRLESVVDCETGFKGKESVSC